MGSNNPRSLAQNLDNYFDLKGLMKRKIDNNMYMLKKNSLRIWTLFYIQNNVHKM